MLLATKQRVLMILNEKIMGRRSNDAYFNFGIDPRIHLLKTLVIHYDDN